MGAAAGSCDRVIIGFTGATFGGSEHWALAARLLKGAGGTLHLHTMVTPRSIPALTSAVRVQLQREGNKRGAAWAVAVECRRVGKYLDARPGAGSHAAMPVSTGMWASPRSRGGGNGGGRGQGRGGSRGRGRGRGGSREPSAVRAVFRSEHELWHVVLDVTCTRTQPQAASSAS